MKKTIFYFLCAVLISGVAFAAGTSTALSEESSCESLVTAKERILCRLQSEREPASFKDESCRDTKNPAACQALYAKAERCYEETGADKDRCFKKAIGFSKNNVAVEASKNQQNVRQYIVLLLYDLQEKIESEHEKGSISNDDTANLIAKIVSIKQMILDEGTPGQIKMELAILKTMRQGENE